MSLKLNNNHFKFIVYNIKCISKCQACFSLDRHINTIYKLSNGKIILSKSSVLLTTILMSAVWWQHLYEVSALPVPFNLINGCRG